MVNKKSGHEINLPPADKPASKAQPSLVIETDFPRPIRTQLTPRRRFQFRDAYITSDLIGAVRQIP